MNYQEAVDYIENIGRFGVKNSNEHTRMCLSRLGNPDRRVPQIHVAGTNGKGSVCAYLAQIMEESGRKTALFTSPHLVTIRERLQVNRKNISEERFLRIFLKIKELCDSLAAEGLPTPSYFEFLFLMAELYFAEEKADVAVIETGLGGRLDATNSLEQPVISVITSISFDHMQYLGNTIPEIAAEKAGIIKPEVPVVYDASRGEAARVIRAEAERKGAPAYPLNPSDVTVREVRDGEIDFLTPFRYDGRAFYTIRTAALYQTDNAALSLLALKTLAEADPRFADISADTAAKGLYRMQWPGRMQNIAPKTYLDGGHNVDGVRRFAESARAITKGRPACLLFAVVSDKDYTDMIRVICSGMVWSNVFVTEVEGTRRTDADALARLFRENGIRNTEVVRSFRDAYRKARRCQGDGFLFISGSLYLAGEIEGMEERPDKPSE